MTKLSEPQRAALDKIAEGVVVRVYRSNGNVVHGANARAVRSLEELGAAKEAKGRAGGLTIHVRIELTEKGAALRSA